MVAKKTTRPTYTPEQQTEVVAWMNEHPERGSINTAVKKFNVGAQTIRKWMGKGPSAGSSKSKGPSSGNFLDQIALIKKKGAKLSGVYKEIGDLLSLIDKL